MNDINNSIKKYTLNDNNNEIIKTCDSVRINYDALMENRTCLAV